MPTVPEKLCPSCGRQWPAPAAECVCGHRFRTAFPVVDQTQLVRPISNPVAPYPAGGVAPPVSMPCPNCGAAIWSHFAACPNCGRGLKSEAPNLALIGAMWVAAVLSMALIVAGGRRSAMAETGIVVGLGAIALAIVLVCQRGRVERINGWIYLGFVAILLLGVVARLRNRPAGEYPQPPNIARGRV